MYKSLGIILATALLGLSACKAKVTGDGGDAPPPIEDKGINGPDITGQWASGCEVDLRTTSGYRTIEIVFKDKSLSRRTRSFEDRQCSRMSNEKTDTGTFKYIAQEKDGAMVVEYKIALGNGWSQILKEKIVRENNLLYISDYQIGEAVTKAQMIPLKLVQP